MIEQNCIRSDKSNFIILYDVWAVLLYFGLYIFIYKDCFSKFETNSYTIEFMFGLVYRFFAISSITALFFVFFFSFFTCNKTMAMLCYNIPLSAIGFAAYLYKHKDGPEFVTNSRVKGYIYPVLFVVFVALYLLIFLFYIKKRLYYTNKLLCETLKYYKSNINNFVCFFVIYFMIIYILAVLTYELEKHASSKILSTIPRYIFFCWTMMSLIMSSKLFACSLINSKLKTKHKFTNSVDDVFISAGRIFFFGFIHPIRFIAFFLYFRTINPNSNKIVNKVVNVLKKINNAVVTILDVLTFNLLTKKQEFALHCAFYYKTTTLGGIKASHNINSDKNVTNSYYSNVIWLVCVPLFVFFSYFIVYHLTIDSEFSLHKNLFVFVTISYFAILTEFVSYSCNSLLFYYTIDNTEFLETNKNLQNIFMYNNQKTDDE
ncbi:hypothetical protein BDAP_001393 [Binucleata daphniae]